MASKSKKNPGGRPSKYKTTYAEQARKLCLMGATDAELADFFEVSESTINLWKKEYPKFSESIKKGKSLADAHVADKLYQRATGYSHSAVKIFNNEGMEMVVPYREHYPPDTTAGIFWLKNRQKDKWRDKQEIDHTTKGEKLGTVPTVIIENPNHETE